MRAGLRAEDIAQRGRGQRERGDPAGHSNPPRDSNAFIKAELCIE